MTARTYLKQLSQLEDQIQLLEDELLKLREAATQIRGIDYSRTGGRDSPVPGSVLENRIIMQMEHEKKLQRELDSLIKTKQSIISRIFRLKNPKHSKLLYIIYAKERTLAEAADEMGLSYDYVRHIHQKALKDFGQQIAPRTLTMTKSKEKGWKPYKRNQRDGQMTIEDFIEGKR